MSLHTTSAPLAASATRLTVDGSDRGGTDRSASPGLFAGLLQEQKLTAQPISQALPKGAGATAPAQGFRPTLTPPPAATTAPAARSGDAGAAEARRTERATVEAHADSHRSADARTEAHRAQARRTAAADAQRQLQGARAAAGAARSTAAQTDLAASDDVGAAKDAANRARDKAGKDADHQVAANARHEGSGSPVDPPVSSAPGSESSRQGDAAGDAGSTSGQGAGDNNGNGSSSGNGNGNDHGSRAELAGVDAGATQGGAASAAGRMSTDRDVTGDAGPAPALTAATRGGAAHAGSAAAVSRSTSAALDTSSDAATLASNNASTAAALRGDGGGAAAGVSPHGSGAEAQRVATAHADSASSSMGGGDVASSFASALAGATAAAGQPVAAASQGAAGVTAQVPVPVDTPEFGATVMLQVGRFAAGGIEQATLNLNPAELGPIQIQITLDGRQASVDFGAAHGHTRDLLQAALSELAAALQGDGLTLAAARVADLPPTQVDRSGASPWSSPGAESQGSATSAGADAGQGGRANDGQPDSPGNRQGGAQVPGSTPMGGERTQRLSGLGWGQPDASAGAPHAGGPRLGLDLYA